MATISTRVLVAFVAVASLSADQKKLTQDHRVEIMRGLMAEYATVKVPLPRSIRPLDVKTDGSFDQQQFDQAAKAYGPAGRVGDLVQVTHVDIEKESILLEINGGLRKRGGWKDHVQIGMAGPVSGGVTQVNGPPTNAPGGTLIALRFGDDGVADVTSSEVKKMLAPVIEFDKGSATETYEQSLPPAVKQAIEDKKPLVGMDRDQVLLALGRPVRKSRESKDAVEYEDWIYGTPPGRVTFVTFVGPKVVKIKETYAGLGGTIAETPTQP
jgi:hypothetical protein